MTLKSFAHDEDILLAEFNHRLFNTIQVIAIELSNCARAGEAQTMRPLIHDLSERLRALAGLHRLLAAPESFGLLEDYCRSLCVLLVRVFGREDVTPWVRMEDLPLSHEQSLKIALIVVELVTNVLKHSLTRDVGGTVWVDLRAGQGGIELSVCDSLRAPMKQCMTPRILTALAKSLNGEVFVVDRDGYTAGVRFPYAPRMDRDSGANQQSHIYTRGNLLAAG